MEISEVDCQLSLLPLGSRSLSEYHPNLVRQDINFLEFPIWSPRSKQDGSRFEIEVEGGKYIFESKESVGIPDSVDLLILYYFLHLRQKTSHGVGQDTDKNEVRKANWNKVLSTTYEVCKNLRMSTGGRNYERVQESLDKWGNVSIKFVGCFYSGNRKITSELFHVLKYKIIEIEEEGKKHNKKIIEVNIDEDFLDVAMNSMFYRDIDLNVLINLKDPLARRLHEYLEKQFIDRNTIKREVLKLCEKLRMTCAPYPSIVLRKIFSIGKALKKVSVHNPNFTYSTNHYQNKEGQFILEIERHKKIPKNQQALPIPDERREVIIKSLEGLGVFSSSIDKMIREHSVEVLESALKDFEVHRVAKARSGEELGGGYFRKMLPKPGGEYVFSKGYSEKQKSIKNKKIREKEETQKRKADEEEGKRAEFKRERRKAAFDIYLKLNSEERERIIERLKKKYSKDELGLFGGNRNIEQSLLFKAKLAEELNNQLPPHLQEPSS